MLEHLKRILQRLKYPHTPITYWVETANLGIDETDNMGEQVSDWADELTILHTADQPGYIQVLMGDNVGSVYEVDRIDYVADEVVSRVYSITGLYLNVVITNGATAQTLRRTVAIIRNS